jgi:hypothetical protein
MSYMDHKIALVGSIEGLSLNEISIVSGGESPSYSLTGRGLNLSPPSPSRIEKGANAVSAAASVAAVVTVAAQAVAAVAGLFS